MFKQIIYVAVGSGIGGVSRFLMQQYIQGKFFSSFPYGTLCVNILGCFVIGVIYGLSARGNIITPGRRLFLATGICGGFTTFSSFMAENYSLLQAGEAWQTFLYTGLSLAVGFAATFAGVVCAKLI